MCTTAFHTVADQVEAAVCIPFLHLADVVAPCVQRAQASRTVGLLGTAFAMQQPFFVDRLASHGLRGRRARRAAPRGDQRDHLRRAGARQGRSTARARASSSVIDELWDDGAEGVILGCTELELLVKQADCELPVFPSTTLHVEAALDLALA